MEKKAGRNHTDYPKDLDKMAFLRPLYSKGLFTVYLQNILSRFAEGVGFLFSAVFL